MHRGKVLRRGAALAAAVPVALASTAGVASALLVDPTDLPSGLKSVSVRCEHPKFGSGFGPYTDEIDQLQLQATIHWAGAGVNAHDVDFVALDATDDDQVEELYERYASVKRLAFAYLDRRGNAIHSGVIGASFRDGNILMRRYTPEVAAMRFSVVWDSSGVNTAADRTVTCTVPLQSKPSEAIVEQLTSGEGTESARCFHPTFGTGYGPFTPEIERLVLQADVETGGVSGHDVKSVRLNATDDQQPEVYYEQYAQVDKIIWTFLEGTNDESSVLGSWVVGTSVRDGSFTARTAMNDVAAIRYTVLWSSVGKAKPTARSMTCTIPLLGKAAVVQPGAATTPEEAPPGEPAPGEPAP